MEPSCLGLRLFQKSGCLVRPIFGGTWTDQRGRLESVHTPALREADRAEAQEVSLKCAMKNGNPRGARRMVLVYGFAEGYTECGRKARAADRKHRGHLISETSCYNQENVVKQKMGTILSGKEETV